jgi:hypothetical protein
MTVIVLYGDSTVSDHLYDKVVCIEYTSPLARIDLTTFVISIFCEKNLKIQSMREVISSRKSKESRLYNGQNNKDKTTNVDLQNTTDNKRLTNTNYTKTRGWTLVPREDKQFLVGPLVTLVVLVLLPFWPLESHGFYLFK